MRYSVSIIVFLFSINLFSQNDLEALLGPTSTKNLVINTFKSTRIINNHSIELFDLGQLDVRIAHRFGQLNSGMYELYGLDQAKIRIGLEYGLTKNLMLGIGRSTYNKTFDSYLKYRILNQIKGLKNIPFSIVSFSNIAINSLKKNYLDYPFSGRLSFCNQLMVASKINRNLSIQIMPTWVHWNMVEFSDEMNDIFLIGMGFRHLVSRSVSINAEYFFRFLDNNLDRYNNSFSLGIDIETGGHVFQLHLTNSLPMHESGFMTRTQSSWSEGGVHFGFNISREFNL